MSVPAMSRRVAERVPWCLVAEGVIHVARWTEHNGRGVLLTLVEDGHETAVCAFDDPTPYDQLLDRTMWRDRASLGLPVCRWCEADMDLDDRALVEQLSR